MNDNNTKEIKVHFPGEEDIIALSDFFKDTYSPYKR